MLGHYFILNSYYPPVLVPEMLEVLADAEKARGVLAKGRGESPLNSPSLVTAEGGENG